MSDVQDEVPADPEVPGEDSWVVVREGTVPVLQEVQRSLSVADIESRVVPPPGCDPSG